MNSDIRKQYSKYMKQIEPLLNELDPSSLINCGAPKDEYDCLSAKISKMLIENHSKEEIFSMFLYELEHHFQTPNIEILKNDKSFLKDLETFIKRVMDLKTGNSR